MGVIKQGILGGFSGKVGSVIGSSWKGRAVMKAQPLSVSNPNTAGQQAQRTSFKNIALIGSILLTGYVQKVCNLLSGNITGYNLFVKTNKSAYDSTGAFVPANMYVGGGNRPAVATVATGALDVDNNLDVTWTRAAGESAVYDTDKAVFIAICEETNDVWVSPGTAAKSTLADTMTLLTAGGDLTGGLHVHVFPCFISSDGRYCSVEAQGTEFVTV